MGGKVPLFVVAAGLLFGALLFSVGLVASEYYWTLAYSLAALPLVASYFAGARFLPESHPDDKGLDNAQT